MDDIITTIDESPLYRWSRSYALFGLIGGACFGLILFFFLLFFLKDTITNYKELFYLLFGCIIVCSISGWFFSGVYSWCIICNKMIVSILSIPHILKELQLTQNSNIKLLNEISTLKTQSLCPTNNRFLHNKSSNFSHAMKIKINPTDFT